MPFSNYIYEYYDGISSGNITVGKWVRLLYEYIVKGLQEGLFTFNAKKANKAIRFIENFCHHCEGRTDLLKLELWQKAAVSVMFGIVEEDGTRVFREVFIVIGRKNGKTLFASAVIAYMAYLDGEYGAKIYCLAPKLEQANIVYDNFYQMIKKEPELSDLSKKRRSDIYIEESNTAIKPLAFNAKKSDGFNPHLVVNDEVASWRGDGGLKQYEVMKSALGARRQPMILSISTAGYENDGIFDELMKRSTAFLKGGSKERRLLPLLYMIDDVEKWNDIEELKKAQEALDKAQKEFDDAQAEALEAYSILEEKENNIINAKSELKNVQADVPEKEEALTAAKQNLYDLTGNETVDADTANQHMAEAEDKLKSAKASKEAANQKVTEAQKKVDEAQKELDEAKEETQTKQKKLDEAFLQKHIRQETADIAAIVLHREFGFGP